MKRAFLALLLAVAAQGCATVEVKPLTTAAPTAERPSYARGHRWIRSDGLWELSGITDEGYVFTRADLATRFLTRDLFPARVHVYQTPQAPGSADDRFDFHPSPRIDWPLAVGKRGSSKGTWTFDFDEIGRFRNPAGHEYTRSMRFRTSTEATLTWVVEAWEEVRVPAGRFEAFKLAFTVTADDPAARKNAPAWSLRIWYAPAIRQIVAAEGRNVGLLAFRLLTADPATADPVQLAIRDPAERSEAVEPKVVVTGHASAGRGVARVAVSVNGAEAVRRDEPSAPAELALEIPITLTPGRNVVIVSVTDSGGQTQQEARTVFFDPATRRAAVESQRATMQAARVEAQTAEAPRLSPEAWAKASAAAADAERAFAANDFPRADEGFRAATDAYRLATTTAADAARSARLAAETRARAQQVAEARRAAAAVDAARWDAQGWQQGVAADDEAQAALGRQDFERAQERFAAAQAAFREAERQALARALAAAQRERSDVQRREREGAERQREAAAAARQDAEHAAAERHERARMDEGRAREREGAEALARGEATVARARYEAAERAYREATRAAAAEATRLAALERERARAEAARAAAARERQLAEAAEAARFADALHADARRKEQEADAAFAKADSTRAGALWADAADAYRRAAAEARAVAQQPLRVALTSPDDQGVVEQEALTVAGSVAAPRGVRMVLLTLNGTEIARREEAARPRTLPVNTTVRLREGPNTIVVTAADADGTLTQEVRTVRYEPPVPLSVSVRFPDEGARVAQASSVVAAVATSSRGVERITITLNGRPVHEQSERRPQRSIVVAAPIALDPGSNAIEIAATEAGGAQRRERRTIVYEAPKAAAPAPVVSAAAPPERWAVIVGVGAYDHPSIPRLRYTVNDAEALQRALVESAGLKPENVLLLTDRTERKPTLRTLKWALGTFLARSARKSDTVFIFFAGHGAPEVDVSGRERDGLAKYLVPIDADPDDLYATGLPMEEFETIFSRIEAERVVVFLDACYSGAAGGRTFASRKTRAISVNPAFLDRLAKVRGRAIVTASRAAELSLEVGELGHGLFTYYLVEGLKGAGDLDGDGTVTLQEIYQYVEREVSQRSRAVGGNQHPVLKGEMEGQLPMVKVRR